MAWRRDCNQSITLLYQSQSSMTVSRMLSSIYRTLSAIVKIWPPLAGDCSSTWEQTSRTGGLLTLKSTTMDLNHCVQKLPSATRRSCYAVYISTRKLQTTSLNNACPNWVMPYCKPMMILFFSATWIAAPLSQIWLKTSVICMIWKIL